MFMSLRGTKQSPNDKQIASDKNQDRPRNDRGTASFLAVTLLSLRAAALALRRRSNLLNGRQIASDKTKNVLAMTIGFVPRGDIVAMTKGE
jgi:hypothetical protein